MTIIRVNPVSLVQYAGFASEQFERIRTELEALTLEVVNVRYDGPNAVAFKTEVGQLAVGLSTEILRDLGHIAAAVTQATSGIAHALGGAPVRISVNGASVAAPAVVRRGDAVDIDTGALEALKPLVARRLGAVDGALHAHLRRLEATDWQGRAKDGAVEAVAASTATARSRTDEAHTSIARAIDHQVEAVTAADR